MAKNFLSPLNFSFTLGRTPTLEYFVQKVNLPGVGYPQGEMPTPLINIPMPGNKLMFQPLEITFKVDENLGNYLEIFSWLEGLGHPVSFDQYAAIANNSITSGNGVYSDATLTILSSKKNPNKSFTFTDCFPISLGALRFETTTTDIDYVTCDTILAYRSFGVS